MGLAIKELRRERGMEQTELAKALGFEHSTMSRKESGRIAVGRHELKAFAKALGTDVSDLVRRQAEYMRMEQQSPPAQQPEASGIGAARQVQAAMEQVGESVLQVCETSTGRRRQMLLDQLVAYARWIAETSRHSDDVGVHDPVIGKPYDGPMLKAPPIVLDDGTLVEKYVPAVSVVSGPGQKPSGTDG